MNFHSCSTVRFQWVALGILALAAGPLWSEDVFVTSFFGPSSADVTPCPPSCVTGTVSDSGSTSVSSPIPPPLSPGSGRKARYGYGPGCSWSVTPTDTGPLIPAGGGGPFFFTTLQQVPGLYGIYVTQNNLKSGSTNLIVNMTATGGILSDVSGKQQASIPLTVFQAGQPVHAWIRVGYISNFVSNPTISFTYASGTLSPSARWYMDAVRFQGLCCCPYIPELTVVGPLVAGQSSVLVTNVAAGATNVIVYADACPIGATNHAAGFAAGLLTVPTTALQAGAMISAVQVKVGCRSAMLVFGPTVEPFLITTPYAGLSALWGRSATLSVTVTGAGPVSYQWFKGGAALGSATGSAYSLPAVGLADAGYYSVVVSNELKLTTNSGPLVVRSADLGIGLEPGMFAGINITGAAGYRYQVQFAPDLGASNPWVALTNLILEQTVQIWVDTSCSAVTHPQRFYRILPAP
ncbi:MAG TPA: immunoglobulin domain-containing protein [Verrucomicrobiota bacterium]|nr:immunoglobulin domain-containing protein [Verrucomicrobiota bacterium]HQL77073.1 immunoglobulin domain-containing protein [Verrucomicrobiota bacterium]